LQNKASFYFQKAARALFWGILVWLLLRSFFLQVALIPSASMRGTLKEGDHILVNKLAYGARVPITPLSFPFGNEKRFVDWIQLPYWRLPGYSEIKRNDILVFNLPSEDNLPPDMKTQYVKRCVALPGDTLEIINGEVFINSKRKEDATTIKYRYSAGGSIDPTVLKKLGIEEDHHSPDKVHHTFFITGYETDSLQRHGYLLLKNTSGKGAYNPALFPNDPQLKWNIDYFGPVVMPKEGDSIQINQANFSIYKRLLTVYEKRTVMLKNDSLFIDQHFTPYYSFTQNYYFTLGDNRYLSTDSRYWGFVPEDHIIGKASLLLFANGKLFSTLK